MFDASAMAVGGMVGGGIFAVLGEAAGRAGNGAWVSFLLAGVLALLTGLSYARLTVDFDEAGGGFSYVEHLAGPRSAGTLSWFLLLGYVFTLALYARTFGEYGARLAGLGAPWPEILGCGIAGVLAGLNLLGVRESGLVEDLLVTGKVLVLLAGGLGCLVAAVTLVVDLRSGDPGTLRIIGAIAAAILGLRLLFQRLDPRFEERSREADG